VISKSIEDIQEAFGQIYKYFNDSSVYWDDEGLTREGTKSRRITT
jgi:hypothetical protein